MFNLLISGVKNSWETDQLMRMERGRFKEYSGGHEAEAVSLDDPITLKLLEKCPTLLMYEKFIDEPYADHVRFGFLREIRSGRTQITFRFAEEGWFPRSVIEEFEERLGIHHFEYNRTHWAVKDGGIPSAMLSKLHSSYDVVLSFAGEERSYVERVATFLRKQEVRVFYDGFEEAGLWGKDLAEHLHLVYQQSGKFCVMFISKSYAEKMWTIHERRSALERALKENREYILPARFDDTELPGLQTTISHIHVAQKEPAELGRLILEKLGKRPIN